MRLPAFDNFDLLQRISLTNGLGQQIGLVAPNVMAIVQGDDFMAGSFHLLEQRPHYVLDRVA